MNIQIDRFKRRRAALTGRPIAVQPLILATAADVAIAAKCPERSPLPANYDPTVLAIDADALLSDIHGKLDGEKVSALIDACQEECLKAVVRPFGIARVLFEDKLGGNVATVQNVRSAEYRAAKNTAWGVTGEKDKYEKAMVLYNQDKKKYEEYVKQQRVFKSWEENGCIGDPPTVTDPVSNPKYKYRDGHKNYRVAKYVVKKRKGLGTLDNRFGDGKFTADDDVDMDHAYACEKIETDPARVLAELYGPDLANIDDNINPMLSHINKSKNDLSADSAIVMWKQQEPKRLKNIQILEELKNSGRISIDQEARLRKLQQIQQINEQELRVAVEKGKYEITKIIEYQYYTSVKFVKQAAFTSAFEGGRMGLQQALGVLLEEFVRASFTEVKDVWQNGFRDRVNDTFIDTLRQRLLRVALCIQAKWKQAACGLRDGFISGFLSNLVNIVVNAIGTVTARWGRIIREGGMSLYRAMKALAFPAEGATLAEAANAACKLLVAGMVTAGGILLEEAVEKALMLVLGPLSPYVAPVLIGIATGLCSVFAVHMLDRLDLFGVNGQVRHAGVMASLEEMISLSYDNAIELASTFDPPPLLHLA